MDYGPSMLRGVALLVVVAIGAGCGGSVPAVTRIVGGERREEHFVSPYAYEQFVRGELAAAEGDLPAAAAAFRRARAGPEDDPYVIARLADVLDRMGQRAEAQRVLDEGLALDPRSEAVYLTRGRIAERHGDEAAALAAYHRAEQSAPRSARAPLALARMLREHGDLGRSEAVLRRYLSRVGSKSPGALRALLELALVRRDREAAVRAARALLRVAPARADVVRRTARMLLARGDPVVAADLLDTLPRSEAPVALRVRAWVAAGRPDRAEALIAATSPQQVGGLAGQARLYLAVHQAGKAEEVAELAIALDHDPAALLVAGQAELAQGKWLEAAEHLARVPPGTSLTRQAHQALAEALRAQGLPALASEVF